ncbi:MAG: hypothetical protein FWG77_05395 [Treponema sp.]|nr:hypothetical protein [Treponema sp.]
MGVEIIKTYKQEIPALRFIGKKGANWGEWWQNGWFDLLEKNIDDKFKAEYEDWNAYLGLMKVDKSGSLDYWIGMLLPKETTVPERFFHFDFPKGSLAVCWVYGNEKDVMEYHGHSLGCKKILEEQGIKIQYDNDGSYWYFERDQCPRFTTPDEKGNVIADICFFI